MTPTDWLEVDCVTVLVVSCSPRPPVTVPKGSAAGCVEYICFYLIIAGFDCTEIFPLVRFCKQKDLVLQIFEADPWSSASDELMQEFVWKSFQR